MIKKVRIQNYKQFDDITISFNESCNIIVGNNEAGKTSLLEAINLALTSKLYGRNIMQELSPYLFNKNLVKRYVDEIKNGNNPELPEILIEVFFDEKFEDKSFQGPNNSLGEDCCGVYLKILFDNAYQNEYEQYKSDIEEVTTIPIEYYTYEWLSFAYGNDKFTKLPLRTHLINNLEYKHNNGVDKYIASLLEYNLGETDKAILALKYRKLKEDFINDEKIKNVNDKFKKSEYKISEKEAIVSIDTSAKTSWDSTLSLYLDNIPYKFIGKGEQNAVKTKLAIKSNIQKSSLIMIEEPETSLSFTNLNKLISDIELLCENKQIIITTHSSFLMNKTGLDKTILLNGNKWFPMRDLNHETYDYFRKLPGYDTLRMILAEKSILVEGPSDELIIQKAYIEKYGKLPIENKIDVISVRGLSFKRFLDIAKIVGNNVVVVTDNDGDITALKTKYKDYENCPNIKLCWCDDENLKTLEPNILASNDINNLKTIFNKSTLSDKDFIEYFKNSNNKTTIALKIFDTDKGTVNFPQYIEDAITE